MFSSGRNNLPAQLSAREPSAMVHPQLPLEHTTLHFFLQKKPQVS